MSVRCRWLQCFVACKVPHGLLDLLLCMHLAKVHNMATGYRGQLQGAAVVQARFLQLVSRVMHAVGCPTSLHAVWRTARLDCSE
jgi:hypothetical protein